MACCGAFNSFSVKNTVGDAIKKNFQNIYIFNIGINILFDKELIF